MSIYEPREDSYLLAHFVRKYAFGNVLDIGTGSGIQATTAANLKKTKKVIATDINPEAIKFCKKNSRVNNKITYLFGDLFEPIKKSPIKKFDTILFNPPYLPQDHEKPDVALIGGKKGHETLERALNQVSDYLTTNGRMLIVFSSLTNQEKVDEIIKRNLLQFKELGTLSLFFERLYVYLITKTTARKTLEKLGVKNILYFAKGTRKNVYTADYKNKKVLVKTKRQDNTAQPLIKEAQALTFLKGLAPQLIHKGAGFIITEYIPGIFLKDWLPKASKEKTKWLFKKIFNWCFELDKKKISKEEMHHPWKHVLINGNKIGMIDFERTHKTNDPKNVSQFAQFVINNESLLRKKEIKINRKKLIEKIKKYKKIFGKKEFEKVIEFIL